MHEHAALFARVASLPLGTSVHQQIIFKVAG